MRRLQDSLMLAALMMRVKMSTSVGKPEMGLSRWAVIHLGLGETSARRGGDGIEFTHRLLVLFEEVTAGVELQFEFLNGFDQQVVAEVHLLELNLDALNSHVAEEGQLHQLCSLPTQRG